MIRAVQPGTVLVELCRARAVQMMAPPVERSAMAAARAMLRAPGGLKATLLGLGIAGLYAALKHAGMEPSLEFKVRRSAPQRERACYLHMGC